MSKDSTLDKRFRPVRLATVSERERLVLSLIRGEKQVTRSDLIRTTALPGAAVFRVTEDLAGRGLIDLGESVAHGPGKPSTMVRLRGGALATVGLSVMTDYAEAVLLDFAGEVRARREVTVEGMDCEAVLDRTAQFIAEEGQIHGLEADAIFALGIAFAGFFVGEGSRMNPAAPLDSWALRDLEGIASARIGLNTTVENIASAAAVGERLLGAGTWADSFAYVNVAHGLGAGLILNGELYRGRFGNSGEVAGMLNFAKLPVPNLESLRAALAREGIDTSGVNDLVTRYRDDWPGISSWVAWAEPSFSFLASLFRQTLDCDAMVLGGRLPPALAERIARSIRWPEDLVAPRRDVGLPATRVVAAEVTLQSAAIGAAAIPLRAGYFL